MRPAAGLGLLALALAVAPLALPPFFLQLLTEIAIVGLFATAFNLLMGFGGMVSATPKQSRSGRLCSRCRFPLPLRRSI